MKPCSCGKDVCLRVIRVTINQKRGVHHWIEHKDGSVLCDSKSWCCTAVKPYPKDASQHEYAKLLSRWQETP